MTDRLNLPSDALAVGLAVRTTEVDPLRDRQLAMASAGFYAWDWDMATDHLAWSHDPAPLLGPAGPTGYPDFRFQVHPDSRSAFLAARRAAIEDDVALDLECRLKRTDGETAWLEMRGSVVRDAAGIARRIVGVARDISDLRHRDEALRRAEAIQSTLLACSPDPVALMDHAGRVLEFNPAAQAVFGWDRDEALGRTLAELVIPLEMRSQHAAGLARYIETGRSTTVARQMDTRAVRRDGTPVDIELSIVRVPGENPPIFTVFLRDVTELKQSRSRIEELATRDPLTGLPNRKLLIDRLEQALAGARRDGSLIAVMFLDLDRFQDVNDTLGHQVGDEVIRVTAQRLRAALREGDTVARQGGDEFIILLTNLTAQGHAALVAAKLLAAIGAPCTIEGHEILTSATVGIAVHPADGSDAATLLKNADTALHHAKESGAGGAQFFTRDMNVAAQRRLALETALRRTVQRGEITLFYQPQIDLATGAPIGFEALARWRHPELGLVPPGQFIRIAEETGLIVPLGEQVLRAACIEAARWQRVNGQPMRVAVNVSAHQFRQKSFVDVVRSVLEASGLPATCLDLEITESTLMTQGTDAIAGMHALGDMGVQLTIDDFGTGYASLNYLKRLPIDALKIDQSFVRDLLTDPDDASIVNAIAGLGQSLGLTVMAEGVEDEDQADSLLRYGCTSAQGFHFGVPVPPGQVVPYITMPRHRR